MSDRKRSFRSADSIDKLERIETRDVFLARIGQIEEEIRNNPTETLVVTDEDGNELRRFADGKEGEIKITLTRAMMMQGQTVTHNHPNDSMLSDGDVNNLTMQRLREIRAVGKEWTYSLRRVRETEKTKNFDTDYAKEGYTFAGRNADHDWDISRGLDESYRLPNGLYDKHRFITDRFNFHLRRWMRNKAPEYGFEFTARRNAQ